MKNLLQEQTDKMQAKALFADGKAMTWQAKPNNEEIIYQIWPKALQKWI